MIKAILKKLFFIDAPAQGAFFALTLCGVMQYILYSAIFGLDYPLGAVLTGELRAASLKDNVIMIAIRNISALYALLLIGHFYYHIVRKSKQKLWLAPGILALYAYGAYRQTIDNGMAGLAAVSLVFAVWALPMLATPLRRWYEWLLCSLGWSLGIFIWLETEFHIRAGLQFVCWEPRKTQADLWFRQTADALRLSGNDWGWVLPLGAVSLAAGLAERQNIGRGGTAPVAPDVRARRDCPVGNCGSHLSRFFVDGADGQSPGGSKHGKAGAAFRTAADHGGHGRTLF